MGSGSSKDSPSTSSGPRRPRSRVLSASCFGLPSSPLHDLDFDGDDEDKENGSSKGGSSRRTDEIEIKSSRESNERSRRHRKMPPLVLGDVDQNGIDQQSSSSSNATGAISSNQSIRSRSRFRFIPDRIGSRLSRAISLGSSRAQSPFPESSHNVDSQNENEENVDTATNGATVDQSPHRNHVESVNDEVRRYNANQLEGSVRFNQTLSIGRLRDRVLRRSSSTTLTLGSALLEPRSATEYNLQVSDRRGLGTRQRLPPYDISSLTESSSDSDNGSFHLRERSHNDLVEQRSAFLERRRRIRSQVNALQRLGSRFENLSGHERSCNLSGQHRTGWCTCRATNGAAPNNDESGTRASISRIVMLAEALFEVLDEIHQQSVALTSRPSFSSIGSVPAPKEVVECMPVKVYMKPQKHQQEEVAQCYICLVEYEDGDFMRILPCSHEFHQTCIDKWLKEIHRVCPLCRGDVCRTKASGTNKIS